MKDKESSLFSLSIPYYCILDIIIRSEIRPQLDPYKIYKIFHYVEFLA